MIYENVEKHMNIKLPREYKDFIEYNIFEMNSKNLIKLRGKDINIKVFLSFDIDDEFYILKIYNEDRDILLDDLIPFAITEFDEYICLDYKNGRDVSPRVVYYDTELAIQNPSNAVFDISDSFKEFLKLIDI